MEASDAWRIWLSRPNGSHLPIVVDVRSLQQRARNPQDSEDQVNHYHLKHPDGHVVTIWVPDHVYIGSFTYCSCNIERKKN